MALRPSGRSVLSAVLLLTFLAGLFEIAHHLCEDSEDAEYSSDNRQGKPASQKLWPCASQ
jgi:hypothetical protein